MFSLPKLKLTSGDLAAQAQTTRLLFRLGGVSFEDEKISERQVTTQYGQVPVLEVDGERLAEPSAIQRYAARVAGLYPLDDPVAAAMGEEILTTIGEINETVMGASTRETDPEKKKHMQDTVATVYLPRVLGQLEARLTLMNQYPYFQNGTRVYLHEVALSELVGTLASGRIDHIPASIPDKFRQIMAIHSKVLAAATTEPATSALHATTQPAFQPHQPTKLRMSYVDVRGRGEFVRLALHVGGIAFDDERVSYEEMGARKPILPYGQLPVFQVDGSIMLAQSFALLRYACTLGGMYPLDSPLQAARMDDILACVEAINYAFQYSSETKDMDERRRLREQLLDAKMIPTTLGALEARVAHSKQQSPYTFGDHVSIADFAVFYIVDFIKSGDFDFVPVALADEFPSLVAIRDAVLNHPKVKEWYATR